MIYEHEADINGFTVDNLGQIYVMDDDRVTLLDSTYNPLFTYSDPLLGEVSNVDFTSSLRVMLFFQDQGMFAITDNTLTLQQDPTNLNDFGLAQVQLICTSENNQYWCYDAGNNQLVRIGRDIGTNRSSIDLSMAFDHVLDPNQMLEHQGKIYINEPGEGVHLFDVFGNYEMTLPIVNCKEIEVVNEHLYFLQDGNIFEYNLKSFSQSEVMDTDASINSFEVYDQQLFYMIEKKIYKQKLP